MKVLGVDIGVTHYGVCMLDTEGAEGRAQPWRIEQMETFAIGDPQQKVVVLVREMARCLRVALGDAVPDVVVIEKQVPHCVALCQLMFATQGFFHGLSSRIKVVMQTGQRKLVSCKSKECDEVRARYAGAQGKGSKYRMNKALAVTQVTVDLQSEPEWLEKFNGHGMKTGTKRDDVADAYLHAKQYLLDFVVARPDTDAESC